MHDIEDNSLHLQLLNSQSRRVFRSVAGRQSEGPKV